MERRSPFALHWLNRHLYGSRMDGYYQDDLNAGDLLHVGGN
jgi:hypothetical protein